MLRQLVYVSAASEDLDAAGLEQILESARRNNGRLGVTGMLLHAPGQFIQVLEGEEPAIEELYRRIAQDRRHSRCLLLLSRPIEQRAFPDWKMGFRKVSAEESEREGFVNLARAVSIESRESAGHRLLASFLAANSR